MSGVTVKNCQVRNFGIGIFLQSSSGNTLIKNRATHNTSSGSGGFRLSFSDGNILEDNFAYRNSGRGFVLDTSSGNTLMRNAAIQNDFRGFDLTLSSNGNSLTENTAGRNFSAGFVISDQSTGNTLTENESIRSSSEGFAIFSAGNTLTENIANDNGTFGFNDTTGVANIYPPLTAPDANHCTGNASGGSSPTGLCTPQP